MRRFCRLRRTVGITAPLATKFTAQPETMEIQRALGAISSSGGSAEMAKSHPKMSVIFASTATALSPFGNWIGERCDQISGASVAMRYSRSCSKVAGCASGPPSHATTRPFAHDNCKTLTPGLNSPGSGSIPNKRSKAISRTRCSFSKSLMIC